MFIGMSVLEALYAGPVGTFGLLYAVLILLLAAGLVVGAVVRPVVAVVSDALRSSPGIESHALTDPVTPVERKHPWRAVKTVYTDWLGTVVLWVFVGWWIVAAIVTGVIDLHRFLVP